MPDCGGDTLFSDMYAAYDGLDQATKDEIDGLEAVHDFTQTFGHTMSAEERRRRRSGIRRCAIPWSARTPPPGSCTST